MGYDPSIESYMRSGRIRLTVAWAANAFPPACRWLLNTQALFLVKTKEPSCKYSDDEVWLQSVPESDVVEVGPEAEADLDMHAPPMQETVAEGTSTADPPASDASPPAVRPIQMGDFCVNG